MKKIYIINGPNLNFTGIREVEIYGSLKYEDMMKVLMDEYSEIFDINIFQSNYEGEIIDILQKAYYNNIDGVIINAGAYTHYSYAIRDAISSINIPTIEVHLSDIYKREEFRKISVISDSCILKIHGKGINSYREALDYFTKG